MHTMTCGTATRQTPWRLVAWLVFVLALTTLNFASRLLVDAPEGEPAYRYSTSAAFLIQGAIMVGILLLISRGLPVREAFGLQAPASWLRAGGRMLAVLVGIFVVMAILGLFLDAGEEQGLVPDDWSSNRTGAFIAFFASATIVAPLVEELTFRGVGFSLLAPYGLWVAIITTGCLFAAVHGLLAGFPVLATFGILLGWLRARTESVYPPMIVHSVFNGIVLIVSVAILD